MKVTVSKQLIGKTLVWQERADAKSEWEPEQSAKIVQVSNKDVAVETRPGSKSIDWVGVYEPEIYLRVVRIQ